MPEDELQRSIGKLEGKMDLMVSSMQELTAAFANLEKGRLSTLEINFAKMQTELADKSRAVAFQTSMITALVVGIAVTVIGGLLLHFWFHIG